MTERSERMNHKKRKASQTFLLPKESLGTILRKDWSRNRYAYMLLLPVIAFYILFKFGPMSRMIIAFQDYKVFKGIAGSEFIGFQNFSTFFATREFWRLLRNTLLLSFYSIIFHFPMPIIFAIMINEVKSRNAKRVMQTISYMPHFISIVVISGLLRNFLSSEGIINSLIGLLNSGWEKSNLLGNAEYFRTIVIGSDIWQQMGWDSIIYLATLSTIDPQLYEAAYVDGANKMQRILHVTLPGIVPVISVQFIMRLGAVMGVGFEKILLIYNPAVYETADVIGTYMYRYAFLSSKYGLGAAVGVFNTLINIIVLITVNSVFRRVSENSLW